MKLGNIPKVPIHNIQQVVAIDSDVKEMCMHVCNNNFDG
jgi:hypothetical protein